MCHGHSSCESFILGHCHQSIHRDLYALYIRILVMGRMAIIFWPLHICFYFIVLQITIQQLSKTIIDSCWFTFSIRDLPWSLLGQGVHTVEHLWQPDFCGGGGWETQRSGRWKWTTLDAAVLRSHFKRHRFILCPAKSSQCIRLRRCAPPDLLIYWYLLYTYCISTV